MTTESLVRAAFAFEPRLCKGEAPMPKGQAGPMKRLAAIVKPWLEAQAPKAAEWAAVMLAHSAAYEKANVNPMQRETSMRDWCGVTFVKGMDTGLFKADAPDFDMGALFDDIASVLVDAAFAAVTDVGEAVGVDLTSAPDAAILYARERAADLVGKKLVSGELVDNPNGMFSVSDTLRGVVRDTVTQAITEGWSPDKLASALRDQFGDWRAETIARTETGYAYGNGAAEGYRELGVEYVEIVDGPGCLPDGHDEGAGPATGTPGEIEDDAEADGQVWTVDQYQDNILGHPNCVRSAVPSASADEESATTGDES